MSTLAQLKKEELLKLAHKFEITTFSDADTKPEIINGLEEAGIGYPAYKKFFIDSDEEEIDEAGKEMFGNTQILVKMERKNGTFEAFGERFTREHPYALVSEATAQEILDSFDGFRLASPSEAKSYYS